MSAEPPLALPVWVGPLYRGPGLSGVRLAVLADKEPERGGDIGRVGRGLDCTLTQQYIDGTMPHREFTDVARLVLGRPAARAECEDFWRAVAFANPAGPSGGTRRRPIQAPEDSELTRRGLHGFLVDVEPQALLVFGAHLLETLSEDGDLLPMLEGLKARTAVVQHPGSAGFSYRDHQDEVRPLGIR